MTLSLLQTPVFIACHCVIPEPSLDLSIAGEFKRQQQLLIERPHLSETSKPQINMSEAATHVTAHVTMLCLCALDSPQSSIRETLSEPEKSFLVE